MPSTLSSGISESVPEQERPDPGREARAWLCRCVAWAVNSNGNALVIAFIDLELPRLAGVAAFAPGQRDFANARRGR